MRRFVLNRLVDETGISGTGIVAEGIEFENGKCVLSWLTQPSSIVVHENMENVVKIHGHVGKTQIEWIDK